MKFPTSTTLLTAIAITVLSGQFATAQQELFNHSHDSHGSLHTESGMLLGVYAQTTQQGLTITDTIPGYSAEGRLFAGDILLQATAEGMPTFSIRSHADMEQAKSQIGPFREAAIEFFRPGVGNQYAWVTFKPIGGGDPHAHGHDHPHAASGPSQGGQPLVHNSNQFPNGGFPSNPNNVIPRSPLPGSNPNNSVPFSSNFPGNPNNFQPKIGNPNNQTPSSEFIAASPNNISPHSVSRPTSPNNTTMRSTIAPQNNGRFQAEFRLESEKPGARLLFKNRGGNSFNTPQFNTPQTQFPQNFESTQPQTRTFRFGGR